MTERRFVLVDFTHMNRVGCLRLYEVGQTYALPRAIAHAATKLRTRRQTAATGLGAAEYVSASKGANRGRGDRGARCNRGAS